jgi:hypothetical protein
MVVVVAYVATFIGVAIAVWLVFSLACRIVTLILRAARAEAKADRLLDTHGAGLPDAERIKDPGGFRGGIWGTDADLANGARSHSPTPS